MRTVFILAPLAIVSASSSMTKHMVKGTRCIDGSDAGFYFQKATTRPELLVWHLEGGGACDDLDSCVAWNANNDNTPSESWQSSIATPHNDWLSNDCTVNPDFCGAHKVYVPYCTGDIHSGTRTESSAWTSARMPGWFAGHANFEKFVDVVLAQPEAADVTRVLLTGTSAGGAGTVANVDYLQQRVPNVTVKGAPVAGYFFPGAPAWEGSQCPEFVSDYDHESVGESGAAQCSPATPELWRAFNISADCVADRGGDYWKCQTAHVAVGYIAAPMFWGQNQFDTNQIFTQLGAPNDDSAATTEYVAYFGNATRASMSANLPAKDGAFLPSCLDHTGMAAIGDAQYLELMGDWFWERSTTVLFDDCVSTDGGPCNPACP